MEPLGSNTAGFVAVGVCATLSIVATGSFVLYVVLSLLLHLRQRLLPGAPKQPEEEEQRVPHVLRLFQTQFGFLFANLVLADLIQAVGFAVDLQWVRLGAMDPDSTGCDFQASMIEMGDVGSALWSFVIALHTVLLLALRWQPPTLFPFVAMIVVWGIVSMLGFIGPVALENQHQDPFYGTAGGWCWIASQYESLRFIMQYTFLLGALFLNGAMYTATWIVVRRRKTLAGRISPEKERLEAVAKRMLGYPIVYMALVLPLSIYRFAGAAGHTWPIPILLAAGAIYTLSGLANIVLFSLTRNVLPVARLNKASRLSLWVGGNGSGHTDSAEGKNAATMSKDPLQLVEDGNGFVTVDLHGNPSFIAFVPEEEDAAQPSFWRRLFGRRSGNDDGMEVIDIRQENLAHAILLRGNSLRLDKELPDVPKPMMV